MKRATKNLLVILCAVLLVAVSVMGTIAYLIDQEEVLNTFTVGDVNILLDEADVTPEGELIEGADRVDGNEYHLVPGKEYVKDPTVTVVKGSEESYVRMLVTITHISELKAIFGDEFLPEEYVEGWDSAIWPCVAVTENDDNSITYEFRYHETVDAFESDADVVLEPLFTSFTLPGEVSGEELATIRDMEISVVAHAIQAVALEDADAAWAAFDAQVASDANP